MQGQYPFMFMWHAKSFIKTSGMTQGMIWHDSKYNYEKNL